MYDKENIRVYNLGCTAGVSPEIVRIFTSRIPKDYVKISASGKERHKDGDVIILPVLDRLYDLKGVFSENTIEYRNLSSLHQIRQDKRLLSFRRFALINFLPQIFPREKSTISEKMVRFPKEVNLLTLTDDEINILFSWISGAE